MGGAEVLVRRLSHSIDVPVSCYAGVTHAGEMTSGAALTRFGHALIPMQCSLTLPTYESEET